MNRRELAESWMSSNDPMHAESGAEMGWRLSNTQSEIPPEGARLRRLIIKTSQPQDHTITREFMVQSLRHAVGGTEAAEASAHAACREDSGQAEVRKARSCAPYGTLASKSMESG